MIRAPIAGINIGAKRECAGITGQSSERSNKLPAVVNGIARSAPSVQGTFRWPRLLLQW